MVPKPAKTIYNTPSGFKRVQKRPLAVSPNEPDPLAARSELNEKLTRCASALSDAPERRVPVFQATSPFSHLQCKISEDFTSEDSDDELDELEYNEPIVLVDRENNEHGFPLNKRNAGFKLSLMVNTVTVLI